MEVRKRKLRENEFRFRKAGGRLEGKTLGQRRGLKKPWAGEEENKNALPGMCLDFIPKTA
jgi:hypothetical protein